MTNSVSARLLLMACLGAVLCLAPVANAQAIDEQKAFADGLFSRGLNAMAIAEYQKALVANPAPAQAEEILFRLAEAHRAEGDVVESDRFYRQVMTDHPSGPYRFRAEFRRTELYLAAGRYEEAAGQLQDLIGAGPPDDIRWSATYFLGYSHRRTGASGQAANAFRQVVDGVTDHPYLPYACLALAEVQMETGSADAETAGLLQRALALAATARLKAEAQFRLADLFFQQQDFGSSAAAYQRLLNQYPSDRRAAEARLQAAWSYLKAERPQDVLSLAAKGPAAGGDVEQGEWWYLQANALRGLGRVEDAVSTYAKIRENLPEHPRAAAAAYEEGLVLFRQGNHTATLALLDGLEANEANGEDLAWLRAEAAIGVGDARQARSALQHILDTFPDRQRTPDARLRLGRLLQDESDFTAARAVFHDLVAKHPDHRAVVDAWIGIAFCDTRLADYEAALRSWQEVTNLNPPPEQQESAFFQRGLVELHLERWGEARATFVEYGQRFPDSKRSGEAAYWLATVHQRLQEEDLAAKAFRAARASDAKVSIRHQATLGLAGVLKKQGDDAGAADLWQSLLQTEESKQLDAPLLEWLARFQFGRGQMAEAAAAAQALAEMGSGGAWSEIGWFLNGEAHASLGDAAASRQAWQRAATGTSGTRESVEAAFRLATQSAGTGDWASAATWYRSCGERASTSDMIDLRARSYYGLGQAAVARGEWDEAARMFMSVGILFDHPQLTPDALFQARTAFANLGRTDEQRNVENELRTRYPESEWVSRLELDDE